jgi:hypothetical protein
MISSGIEPAAFWLNQVRVNFPHLASRHHSSATLATGKLSLVATRTLDYAALWHRRQKSALPPLWELQIIHTVMCDWNIEKVPHTEHSPSVKYHWSGRTKYGNPVYRSVDPWVKRILTWQWSQNPVLFYVVAIVVAVVVGGGDSSHRRN